MSISLATVNQIFQVVQAVIQEVQELEAQWNGNAAPAPASPQPPVESDSSALDVSSSDSSSPDTQADPSTATA